jgi:hypothetical protein
MPRRPQRIRCPRLALMLMRMLRRMLMRMWMMM